MVSSAPPDKCVHEAEVSIDLELNLALSRVYTTTEPAVITVFPMSTSRGSELS